MKRRILGKLMGQLIAGCALLLVAALPVRADITGSAHDFSASAWSGNRICVACHTPHKADMSVTDAPLWNHANSAVVSYPSYSSTTMNATAGQPSGISKLCLSCHDGTVAVDSFGGATGGTFVKPINNIGNTLADDHPIGITYNTALATADGSLFDPSVKLVTIGSGSHIKSGQSIDKLMLYGGKIECSSCHDVHNTFTVGTTGLLKMDAKGSAICLACHNK